MQRQLQTLTSTFLELLPTAIAPASLPLPQGLLSSITCLCPQHPARSMLTVVCIIAPANFLISRSARGAFFLKELQWRV